MTSGVKEARMVLYIMWVWVFGLVFAGGLSELLFTRFVATRSKTLQTQSLGLGSPVTRFVRAAAEEVGHCACSASLALIRSFAAGGSE